MVHFFPPLSWNTLSVYMDMCYSYQAHTCLLPLTDCRYHWGWEPRSISFSIPQCRAWCLVHSIPSTEVKSPMSWHVPISKYGRRDEMIKIRHSGAKMPEFESCLCYFPAIGKLESVSIAYWPVSGLLWTSEKDAFGLLLLILTIIGPPSVGEA